MEDHRPAARRGRAGVVTRRKMIAFTSDTSAEDLAKQRKKEGGGERQEIRKQA